MHPIILFVLFIFFILPLSIFGLILFKGVRRVKNEEWRGEVIDKIYNVKEEKRKIIHPSNQKEKFWNEKKAQHFYTLVVKTEDGKTRKVAVTSEMYNNCQIGDKLVKRKGQLNPVKE